MRFRYINTAKLVAYYLREFSTNRGRVTSNLYRFVLCLCLPFTSVPFLKERMIRLAIAECTNSTDQIKRVLKVIAGVDISVVTNTNDFYVALSTLSDPVFPYDDNAVSETARVPYTPIENEATIYVTLNGASQTKVAAYLDMLIPFYVQTVIIYN